MAVVTPSVDIIVRESGLSTVSTPTRRVAIAGIATGGSANDTLHTSDPQTIISTFTSGELVELALFCANNSTRQCAFDLVKINGSVAGYNTTVSVTRAGSSTGVMTVTGTPNDSYNVLVEFTSDTTDVAGGDGEIKYSLDGGDSYSNRVAIPTNGQYPVPGTGLTLVFDTPTTFDEADVFSFDCVGPGFTSTDLGNALTALDADGYEYSRLIVIGSGSSASASAVLASTLVTHATTRAAARHWIRTVMQAKHGLKNGTVTLGGTPTATEAITCTGVPKESGYSFKIEITTTGGRGAGVFRWSSDGGTNWTSSVTITTSTGINVLGTTGVTVTFGNVSYTDGNEYTWAPVSETDSDVRSAFSSVESIRLNVCVGDVEIESALNPGRKYRRGLLYSMALKACEDELRTDAGRVRSGVLKGVSNIYRDERLNPGLDTAKFVTSTTYANKRGKYYITQGNLMSADGSAFDLSQLIDIMNESCRITQVYLNELPGEDLRTNDDGTIADEDAEAIDDQLQALLDAGLTVPGHIQRLSARVRRDIPLSTTRKVSASVVMVPKFYVKQADAEIAFSTKLTGEAA